MRRQLAAGYLGLLPCRWLARKPPPRDFFLKIPPTEKVSANAVTDRTLRQTSLRSFLLLHKRHSAHAVPASLICCSHRVDTTSLHVQCSSRGVPLSLELVWHGFANAILSPSPEPRFSCGSVPCIRRTALVVGRVRCGVANTHPSSAQLRATSSHHFRLGHLRWCKQQ